MLLFLISTDPDANYEKIRKAAAENRRNMENSLENYALAIHPSMSLFRDLEQELLDEADRIVS